MAPFAASVPKARKFSMSSSAMRTASDRCLATSELTRSLACSAAMPTMPSAITSMAIRASISDTPRCRDAVARVGACVDMGITVQGLKSRQLPGMRE